MEQYVPTCLIFLLQFTVDTVCLLYFLLKMINFDMSDSSFKEDCFISCINKLMKIQNYLSLCLTVAQKGKREILT